MISLHHIKAIIFDFDGTLAVLNIDFSSMRERIFDLMRRYGVGEELIEERYLLEIIGEVYRILCRESPLYRREILSRGPSDPS